MKTKYPYGLECICTGKILINSKRDYSTGTKTYIAECSNHECIVEMLERDSPDNLVRALDEAGILV